MASLRAFVRLLPRWGFVPRVGHHCDNHCHTQGFSLPGKNSSLGRKMPRPTSNLARIIRPEPQLLGKVSLLTGNVTSNSPLHIDGRVHGDVQCASLVLGENSEIEGNVVAEDVVICGRLIGSVRGVRVILQSSCHVEGDLLHASLAMERGAYFEGKSRRSRGSFGCPNRRLTIKPAADERGPADSAREKPLKPSSDH